MDKFDFLFVFLGFLACMATAAASEPLAFEQAANVTGVHGGVECGTEFSYGLETIRLPGTEDERTALMLPTFIRLGLPWVEAKVNAPFSRSSAEQNAQALQLRAWDFSFKANAYMLPVLTLAAGLRATIPTIAQDQYRYEESLAFYPFLALDVTIPPDAYAFHLHTGYQDRMPYRRRNLGENSGDYAFDPGDAFIAAAGVEIPATPAVWILGEIVVSGFGPARRDGEPIPGSSGSIVSIIPGVRFETGAFKAKLGWDFALESTASRPEFTGRYSWRVLASASLRFLFP